MNKVKPDVRQLPSGRWQARLRLDDGSRKPLGTFDNEGQAEEAWWTARADLKRGQWWDDSQGNTLFKDFLPVAMDILAKRLAVGTIRNYWTLANKNLIPAFGHLPLNKISKATVTVWWTKQPEVQNSRNAFYAFRAVMREAVNLGLIKENPVSVAGAGKDLSDERPEHTIEEFRAVVALLPYSLQLPAWVIFGAHLRVSEMAGLNRGDYDPATNQLRVERQDSEIGGRHLKETKTKRKRSLAILEPAASKLATYYERTSGPKSDPLFWGTHTDPEKRSRLSARRFRIHWDKACKKAGVEDFHVHDIRHIGLTLVGRSGATTADLQKRAGHATVAGVQRYQHSSVARDKELAALVSQSLLEAQSA